jgi:poly-gamma-glutamate synthesis protein (capsule biosynthesis protein)
MEKLNIIENYKKILQAWFLWAFLSISQASEAKDINENKTEIIIDIAWDITPTEDLRNKWRFEQLLNEISKKTSLSIDEVLAYPFSNVKWFFDDSYTIVNLETRALPRKIVKEHMEWKYKKTKSGERFFHFATDEKMIDIIKKENSSIEAVTIANNHSEDFNRFWFDTLKEFVKNENIRYCWDNKNWLQVEFDNYKWVKIAMIWSTIFNSWKLDSEKKLLKSAIEKAKKENAQIIVVYYHWWAEQSIKPEKYQKELARFAAENWATLFAWSHQHVLSWTENYKTKDWRIVPIAYWLWNFMFWWNSNPKDKDSMIFRNTFEYNQKTKTIKLKISENIPVIATWEKKSISKEVDKFIWYQKFRPSPASWEEKKRIDSKISERSKMIN